MKRFQNILFVAEHGQVDRAALEQAVALAERNEGRVTVVGVVPRIKAEALLPEDGPSSTALQKALVSMREESLAGFVADYEGRVEVKTLVLLGETFIEIIRQVIRGGHDLLVKAPRDIDWLDRMFGSEDMHLFRKCPCPVWMHKQFSAKPYGKILAAVNVDEVEPDSVRDEQWEMGVLILELASSLAETMQADLHVAHVWETPGEIAFRNKLINFSKEAIAEHLTSVEQQRNKILNELLADVSNIARLKGDEPFAPTVHLVKGNPAKELPAIAKELKADLILMATLGRSGISGFFFSNTAEMVLEQINCSVLAVKPPKFKSPVECDD